MDSSIARIPQKWVWPVRVVTIILIVMTIAIFTIAIPYRLAQLQQICTTGDCPPLILQPADLQGLAELGLSLKFYAIYFTWIDVVLVYICAALIAVLLWKASDTWIGIVASFALVGLSVGGTNVDLALPPGSLLSGLNLVIAGSAGFVSIILLLCIFPNGRFAPKASKLFAVLFLPVFALIVILSGGGELETFSFSRSLWDIAGVMLVAGLGIGVATQIYRYWKLYNITQRQQVRWVLFAIIGTFISVLVWFTIFDLDAIPRGRPYVLVRFVLYFYELYLGLLLIPVALTISILRYRLWNIDIIFRRTLQYTVISAILALTYFGGVTLIQSITTGLTGANSSLAIVVTTLLVAALFNPLRQRIQTIIDNRFYRRQYDAQQALERFNEQLRNKVDLTEIRSAVVDVLDQTIQPDAVSLWLAPPDRKKGRF